MLGKNLLLAVVCKVLEDHDSILINGPDVVCITFEDVHARLIIASPCSDISESIVLSESLCKVETESVHVILVEEMLEASLHMLLDHGILMIHVVIYIELMLCNHVEPRVVLCCAVVCTVPPHLCPWV